MFLALPVPTQRLTKPALFGITTLNSSEAQSTQNAPHVDSTELSSALKHPWEKAPTNSVADWSLHCCPTAIRRPRALGLSTLLINSQDAGHRQHSAGTEKTGFLHALARCLSHCTTAWASFAHLLFSRFSSIAMAQLQ